ncbi:MAG TPA: hypothetical protein VHI52_01770, partial [Verrucomicrobiae bacterium]|nr:hypothetical protein [Verrucomicrobiae bacterium]
FPEGAAWSADGFSLVGAGTINGVNALYQVATDGSGAITRLAITRPGDRIAYVGAVVGSVAPQLQIVEVHASGGDLILKHTSSGGHQYALQSTPDLLGGPWIFVAGTTNAGTGGLVQITLKSALTGPRQFYRVQQVQ